MTITPKLYAVLAGLVVACGLTPFALAAGEPKNQVPFTRTVSVDRTVAQAHLSPSGQASAAVGEPKNQRPFTRAVGGDAYRVGQQAAGIGAALGEPKNERPFNQPVVAPTLIATPGDGFDWSDAGIGVGAGFGLALVLAGGLLLTQVRPRLRRTGAAAAG